MIRLKTIKLDEGFLIEVSDEEMEILNSIFSSFETFMTEELARKSPIKCTERMYEEVDKLSFKANEFKGHLWAWNKLLKGNILGKEQHGNQEKGLDYSRELITKLKEATRRQNNLEVKTKTDFTSQLRLCNYADLTILYELLLEYKGKKNVSIFKLRDEIKDKLGKSNGLIEQLFYVFISRDDCVKKYIEQVKRIGRLWVVNEWNTK